MWSKTSNKIFNHILPWTFFSYIWCKNKSKTQSWNHNINQTISYCSFFIFFQHLFGHTENSQFCLACTPYGLSWCISQVPLVVSQLTKKWLLITFSLLFPFPRCHNFWQMITEITHSECPLLFLNQTYRNNALLCKIDLGSHTYFHINIKHRLKTTDSLCFLCIFFHKIHTMHTLLEVCGIILGGYGAVLGQLIETKNSHVWLPAMSTCRRVLEQYT